MTPSWDTLRLFLHVLAATVWVGGQLTLAALVPTLRRLGTDMPKAAARQFNRVAWPAFGVLIVTGVWNVVAERDKVTGAGSSSTARPAAAQCPAISAASESSPVACNAPATA